jgi:hypothetical protein
MPRTNRAPLTARGWRQTRIYQEGKGICGKSLVPASSIVGPRTTREAVVATESFAKQPRPVAPLVSHYRPGRAVIFMTLKTAVETPPE